jgi:hypothetical protein
MVASTDWSVAYARQADADLETFQKLQGLEVPQCHKAQFLQTDFPHIPPAFSLNYL